MKDPNKDINNKLNGNNEKKEKRISKRINKMDKIDINENNKIMQKRPLTSSIQSNSRQQNKINAIIPNKNNIEKNIKNEKQDNKDNKQQIKLENKSQIKQEPKKLNNSSNNINKEQSEIKLDNNTELNNTNFLSELPAKMDLDNKTIKSIMPYFDKNTVYTKHSAKNEENIIILYEQKINELMNIYIFTQKYLDFITQTFGKICNPFYQILSSTYNNDVKPYFAYFKNLVNIFETFSDNLKTLGHTIKHPANEENTNIGELMNVEFDLNQSVEKLNLIYADIFSIITNNLKENVLNKPLYTKVDTVEPKFLENLKKMQTLVNKLKHRRDKLINKYKKDYEPLFFYFKDKKEKREPSLYNDLVCMKDFLFLEYDLIKYCNKAFVKIKKFLNNIEIIFNESTNLFCDYLEALKTMIKIYYDENRFIINPNILSKNMITNLDKLIEQDIRKKIEKKLSIKNIIEFSKDPYLRNEMNHLLLNYRDILIQSQLLKDKNKIIDEITNFNLLNFKSTKSFFDFLLDLVPQIMKFNFEKEIQLRLYLKRDAGVFKKWRNTLLVVTQQGHILFMDESPYASKADKLKESSNVNVDIKQSANNENKIEEEPKKIENENDIIIKDELSKGIEPNKLVHIYLKTSYGISITGKKEDKYLFQLWNYCNGNKKSKELFFDALNQENLTQVINMLNDNNDVNITKIDK